MRAPCASAVSAVRSVEPSSTTMTSSGGSGSPARAERTALSVRSALNAGITTLTLWGRSVVISVHPTQAHLNRHPAPPGPPDRVGARAATRPNAGRGAGVRGLAWRADALASWRPHARRQARDD